MKPLTLDSLNTTISNSPPPKLLVRTPIPTASKTPTHRLVTCPSATLDLRGVKVPEHPTFSFLELEIEQLRRENRFLKKKLHQM